MKRIALQSLLLFAVATPALAQGYQVTRYVSNYGAYPNDNTDDSQGILDAISAVTSNSRLIFGAGQYDIDLSGPSLVTTNQSGTDAGLLLSGLSNVLIDGAGAVLVIHGFDVDSPSFDFAGLFRIEDCEGVIVKDLTVDMDRPPFSCGTVTGVNNTGSAIDVDVSFDQEFPVTASISIEAFLRHHSNGLPWGKGCDLYFDTTPAVSSQGSQVLRISLPTNTQSGSATQIAVNDRVSVRHRVYGNNAFMIVGSSDVTLRRVDILTVPGMGAAASACENLEVSGLRIMKKPNTNRLLSTTADGLHFQMTKGFVSIDEDSATGIDTLLEGMGDDGVNIHGYYSVVTNLNQSTDTITIRRGAQTQWMTHYGAGETVDFYGAQSLQSVANATVQSMSQGYWIDLDPDPNEEDWWEHFDLVLDSIPGNAAVGQLTTNTTRVPTVAISNTTFRGNRGRGVLLQTRSATVDGCVFEDCTSAGAVVRCDARDFYESLGGLDVIIKNSQFTRVNNGEVAGSSQSAAIVVSAQSAAVSTPPYFPASGVHSRVLIKDNAVTNTSYAGIMVGSATQSWLIGNQLTDVCIFGMDGSQSAWKRRAISLHTSDGISINGNSLIAPYNGLYPAIYAENSTFTQTGNTGF